MRTYKLANLILKNDMTYYHLCCDFDREFETNGRTEKLVAIENKIDDRLKLLSIERTPNGLFKYTKGDI